MDSVPMSVAAVFLAMLLAIWSIETLQQPNPQPTGPTVEFRTGGSWTLIEPSPRQTIASSAATDLASR